MTKIYTIISRVPTVYWLALGLRCIWAILIPVVPLSDSLAYETFALNIWQHETYGWEPDRPQSYWPVGTSAIYAGLFRIFGHVYWPIVLVQIFVSLAIIYLSRKLCLRFFQDPRVAVVVSYALALWPTGIFYVTVVASELYYMLFSLAGILYFTGIRKAFFRTSVLAALLFTAAYYVRPVVTVTILICAVGCLFYLQEQWRKTLLRTVICFGTLALLVAPWAYRNYQLHNAFVPMSSNSGAVFWMGNHPELGNGDYVAVPEELARLGSYEFSRILKARALETIKNDPGFFVGRVFYKFYRFHSYETIGVSWNEQGIKARLGSWAITPLKAVSHLYWLVLLIAAVVGLVFYFVRVGFWSFALHPFVLIWASNAAIHSLIVAQDRYHLPSVPFIVAFSAIAGLKVAERINIKKVRML